MAKDDGAAKSAADAQKALEAFVKAQLEAAAAAAAAAENAAPAPEVPASAPDSPAPADAATPAASAATPHEGSAPGAEAVPAPSGAAAPASGDEDLEKWAEEQLSKMEAQEMLTPAPGKTESAAAPAAPAADPAAMDPSAMTAEDMEKWAAAQLAAMDEAAAQAPPAPAPAAASAPAPAEKPAVVASLGIPLAFRPAYAAMFLAAMALPAVIVGWVLSARAGRMQRETATQVQQSLEKLEERLTTLKVKELALASREQAARPTLEEIRDVVRLADAHMREARLADAQRLYETALSGDPSDDTTDEARYGLGMCLLKRGKPEAALENFRVVVTRFPGSRRFAPAAVEMADLLMARKEYGSARRVLYQVIGNKDRMTPDEAAYIERASFALARAYEGEARMLAFRTTPSVAANPTPAVAATSTPSAPAKGK